MAPPHLHPRSSATSTLFGVTLLASFVVVGIPHIFPCPRPKNGRLSAPQDLKIPTNHDRQTQLQKTELEIEEEILRQIEVEAAQYESQRRECPVPKPRKVLETLLGRQEALEEKTNKRPGLDSLILHPSTRKA
jgi:cytochrome c oxidase assembly factor 2